MSEQEGAACLSSDTCLRVDENYFGHSMEVTSVQSGDEILAAIDQCKRSIGLVTEEMSDEKRDLVLHFKTECLILFLSISIILFFKLAF